MASAPRRVVLALGVAGMLIAAFWYAFTDLRAKWWPDDFLTIYSRGAIADYLEMRCIQVTSIEFLGKQRDHQLTKTPVSSYEEGSVISLAWRLRQGTKSFLLVTSIFKDADYAVSMWELESSILIDEYVRTKVHGNAGATIRKPMEEGVFEANAIQPSDSCQS